MSPLLDYEWVSLVQSAGDAEASIVRSRVDSGKMCTLKMSENSQMRRHEAKMHKQAADTEFVGSVLYTGSSSSEVFFGVGEFITGNLARRIASRGIADDNEFWRLAIQLASALAAIHAKGIIHLAVQVQRAR